MTFKIGSKRPQTEVEIKAYFDYWNNLLPQETDFVSRAIPLAQFAHESAWSMSELAQNAHNHAGHKFKGDDGWDKKRQYIKDAEEEDTKGNKYIIPDTGWRKYDSDKEFAQHHAKWLSRTPGYTKTYAKALNAKTWQDQLKALQGTYALDSQYYNLVKAYIDKYDLLTYDTQKKGTGTMAFPKPKMTDRRKQALGYPSSGAYARRHKSAIKNLVWHYTATTHAGHGSTVIKSHENYWRNTHGWDIGGYAYYIDRAGNIFWNYDWEVVTYGAGKVNPYTIHVSLEASSPSNYTAAQVKAREELTLWLMQELKLPGTAMRGHYEMPGNSTSCPGYSVAQLNSFRNNLNVKLKAGATGGNVNNPQGLVEISISKYQAPPVPFKTFKVGDVVTLAEGWKWFNTSTNKLMTSKKEKELTGKTGTIIEINDINDIGQSRYAYKLKEYNSWILEEYLVEAKEDWEIVDTPKNIPVPAYREPGKAFDVLKVGQTVSIGAQAQNWYIPETNEWKAPTVDMVGKEDKIIKVIDIPEGASYSKRAYLLEGFHSWILEQDLEDARLSWSENDKEVVDEKVVETTPETVEEGVFRLKGAWYKVSEHVKG